MKKLYIISILTAIFFVSCDKESSKSTMVVKGEIKGLKKGTIFLQKIDDGILSTVDSIFVKGTGFYELSSGTNSSQLHFLTLDNDSEKSIPFFGEPGEININTNLNNFVLYAKISGSKNQEILDQYNMIASRFQNKNLEMIKENFEAVKDKNQEKIDEIAKESKALIRKKYLYTINFALNNKDSEVAPYLALSVLNNANVKYLDTINNSLSIEIKNSRYGKELNSFIEKIKASSEE